MGGGGLIWIIDMLHSTIILFKDNFVQHAFRYSSYTQNSTMSVDQRHTPIELSSNDRYLLLGYSWNHHGSIAGFI